MEHRLALETINEILGLQLGPTFKGDELKGYKTDWEDGGAQKFYLDTLTCQELSIAFAAMATMIKEETPRGELVHRIHCGHDCPKNLGIGPCDLG